MLSVSASLFLDVSKLYVACGRARNGNGSDATLTCSIAATLLQIDTAIQYGEDQEVTTKDFDEDE